MRGTGLSRKDDRVVRRAMAEGAALDEVDADEVGARDGALVTASGLVARERGGTEQCRDEREHSGRGNQDQWSHDVTSLRTTIRFRVEVRHFGIEIP